MVMKLITQTLHTFFKDIGIVKNKKSETALIFTHFSGRSGHASVLVGFEFALVIR